MIGEGTNISQGRNTDKPLRCDLLALRHDRTEIGDIGVIQPLSALQLVRLMQQLPALGLEARLMRHLPQFMRLLAQSVTGRAFGEPLESRTARETGAFIVGQ